MFVYLFQFIKSRVGKKKVLPHVVESETSLEKAFMVFLCDGYTELPYHNDRREVFRFHRKLAPYKITFAAPLLSEADKLSVWSLICFFTD